jgi:hypothetical protein
MKSGPFGFRPSNDKLVCMRETKKLTPALERASDQGIDLSQLYERLSLTPTERLRKNFRMAVAVEEMRKAGQRHRDRKRH